MKTYYIARDEKILIQSNDESVIRKFASDICKEAEETYNKDLGFTVYVRDGDRVFHQYHTWLSSGDGCMHSRHFHPKRDVTEMFNRDYR